jgi:hypothetical protein
VLSSINGWRPVGGVLAPFSGICLLVAGGMSIVAGDNPSKIAALPLPIASLAI